MYNLKKFIAVFIFCIVLSAAAVAQDWQQVVPGLDYRYYRFESPQNDIFITRLDRTSTSLMIDASLANGKITQPGGAYNVETIPSQAAKYDGAFGFWGRTTAMYRYNVVAAINGCGFSDVVGCPDSAMVMNGAFIKRTFGASGTESGGAMGFVFKSAGSGAVPGTCYMGGDLYLAANPNKICLSFTDGTRLNFQKINDKPGADRITLYTHHYGVKTPSTTGVTEIVVKMQNAQPLRIVPWSNYISGTAVEIKKNSSGMTVIPFDCVVIVASGSEIDDLELNVPTVGTEVRISQETNDSTGLDWTNAYCSIGPMWGVILRNSVKPTTTSTSYTTDVHPRTAVAYNSSYIYFIVVDGRSSRSSGMTLSALADFCVSYLGATDAVNNDGGGSSTLWVNGQVKNLPSDAGNAPRPVANGLMMIQLEPKEVSTALAAGSAVTVNTPGSTHNLLTGPGINFHTITVLSHNAPLTVVAHSLNGLRAQDVNGSPGYWWYVKTGSDVYGWVCEYYLNTGSNISNWNIY